MSTATTQQLLAKIATLVSTPRCSSDIKTQAIQHAYELGRIEGRLEGAQHMGEQLVASITEKVPA